MTVRCLIIDDSADFLLAACSLLEHEGIEVVAVASSGAEAVQQAGELRPDVALVDIDLGEESGFEAVQLLAAEGLTRQLDVIMISAYGEADFVDMIAAGPALGYLSKHELSATAVQRILASGRQR